MAAKRTRAVTPNAIEVYGIIAQKFEDLQKIDKSQEKHIDMLTKHFVHLSTEVNRIKTRLSKLESLQSRIRQAKWSEDA